MIAIGELGGSVFDFFYDRGIRTISVCGEVELLTYLRELAYHSKIQVRRWIADERTTSTVYVPNRWPSEFSGLDELEAAGQPLREPILMALTYWDKGLYDRLKALAPSVHTLNGVLTYGYEKSALFAGLVRLKNKSPETPFVICRLPLLGQVKNMDDTEKYVLANIHSSEAYHQRETWPEAVVDKVFRVHGYSDDYVQECTARFPKTRKGGVLYCADVRGSWVNTVNGFRLTTDLPDASDGTVYVFGNSVILGMGTDDAHTIPSFVQRGINQALPPERSMSVVNMANMGGKQFRDMLSLIDTQSFTEDDIVVVGIHSNPSYFKRLYGAEFITCDTQSLFDRPHEFGDVFLDHAHLNSVGSGVVGAAICTTLAHRGLLQDHREQDRVGTTATDAPPAQAVVENTTPPDQGSSDARPDSELSGNELKQLEAFLDTLKPLRPSEGSTGAIVMNCNPFTLGHRYLVEFAAKKVDSLFVFVVEEDKSFFPFADRIELVRKGVSHLGNVTVLPSGRFIISSLTFDWYFDKETIQDEVIDPSSDVRIFGEHIAPALGIQVRFVGEEPFDQITRQYNATMARLLPKYGVRVEIIPRLESGGAAISASRVRALLKERDFAGIADIVPDTTLDYLKAMK
jgi:[citrate (pro-3S)-lyase] ligase